MIADKTSNTVIGKIEGDVARMTIDDQAMAHIMSILTNMYSDVETAVLREYATNAYDSHVEAGTKRPIEVQLPTSLSPYLKIRDFGTGLSVEDIHSMYSRYGASSKRDTNSQTGMLGIGSKSALSYANQFTLTSVKDGVALTAVVSRDEDGGGSMTIPNTSTTAEPNGTEITIPVTRSHDFTLKANRLFQYWPKGSVLVNGAAPEHILDGDVIEIASGIYYTSFGNDGDVVVQGNVPYPHDFGEDIFGRYRGRGRIIAFVPIGTVMFTPSRESLHYTRSTKAALDKIVAAYKSGVKDAVQKKADACSNAMEALRAVIDFSDLPGAPPSTDVTYRGEALPEAYAEPALVHQPNVNPPYWSRRNKAYARDERGIPATTFPGTLWIRGFIPQKFVATHKTKIEKWIEDNLPEDHGVTQYVMLREGQPRPPAKWIDKSRVVEWSEVRKIKLGTTITYSNGARRRLTGSYDLVVNGARMDETPADSPLLRPIVGRVIFWINQSSSNVYWNNTGRMGKMFKNYVAVCLPANRIEKFKREFPHAVAYSDAIKAEGEKFAKRVTEAQKLSLAYYNLDRSRYSPEGSVWERLRSLDANRIDDPELTAAVRAAKMDVETVNSKSGLFSVRIETPKVKNPLTKYPLLRRDQMKHNHTYLYLNAAYAAEQEAA